jgi:hypothetical protein
MQRQFPEPSDTNRKASPAAVVMLTPPGKIMDVALWVIVNMPAKIRVRSAPAAIVSNAAMFTVPVMEIMSALAAPIFTVKAEANVASGITVEAIASLTRIDRTVPPDLSIISLSAGFVTVTVDSASGRIVAIVYVFMIALKAMLTGRVSVPPVAATVVATVIPVTAALVCKGPAPAVTTPAAAVAGAAPAMVCVCPGSMTTDEAVWVWDSRSSA